MEYGNASGPSGGVAAQRRRLGTPEPVPGGKGLVAVVFDVDGTLLDTESVYTAATNHVLAPYGKQLDWSLKQQLMGRPALEACRLMVEQLALPTTAEALLAQRQAYEAAAWPHTAALPGAERLVRSLHALGVPLAVATGSDAASLAAKSAAHQSWFRLFRAVVTASDPAVRRGKPAPDVFQRAAALLGVPPADAGSVLVVEDAVNGVQAALAAGMRVLAVPDPHLLALNRPVFAQADQLLASLEEFDPAFWGLPDFPQC